jgi:hypothetical protein
MTGSQSRFGHNYEFPIMFASGRDEVIPKLSQMINLEKVRITIFFTGRRLPRLAHLCHGQKYHKEDFINEILEGIN